MIDSEILSMSYFQNILFIADNCRILQFLDAKDGSALEKHVIRTIADEELQFFMSLHSREPEKS